MQSPITQRSALPRSQALHVVPGSAHVDSDIDWHVWAPSQQPLGHEVASQTHWLPTQRWPAEHAWPVVPQTHAPPGPQRSASECVLQSSQRSPLMPHTVEVSPWHTPFWQQPLAQLVALQPEQLSPFTQVCGEGQTWQAAPLPPQADGSKPRAQPASLWQQPRQVVASQCAPPSGSCVPPPCAVLPPPPPPPALLPPPCPEPPPVPPSPLSVHMPSGMQRRPTPASRQQWYWGRSLQSESSLHAGYATSSLGFKQLQSASAKRATPANSAFSI